MGDTTSAGGLQDGGGMHVAPGAAPVPSGPPDADSTETAPREWISGDPARADDVATESELSAPAAAPIESIGAGSLGEFIEPVQESAPAVPAADSEPSGYETGGVDDGPVREQAAAWGQSQAVAGEDERERAAAWAPSEPDGSDVSAAPASGSRPASTERSGWDGPDQPVAADAVAAEPVQTEFPVPQTSPTNVSAEFGHRGLSSQAPIQWERPEDPSDLTAATFSANAENHDQADEDATRARDREENHLL